MRNINFNQKNFHQELDKLLSWQEDFDQDIYQKVKQIIKKIRQNGDDAILELTNKFDKTNFTNFSDLKIKQDKIDNSVNLITKEQKQALEFACQRIEEYHKKQLLESWQYQDEFDNTLGQKITALKRVGVYVPGGKASYPSSVIMNVVPAKVAGVSEIIMAVPTPNGEINQLVLAAAKMTGVDQIFAVGGAQAVAALAYGTKSIPKVDKIVGPGNIFVATAKSLVFGKVGIDMIAGPSEILIISDNSVNPDWIAMDLFSQAEHDENAQSILISTSQEHLKQVKNSIDKLLPTMPRKEIIKKSLENRGGFIFVNNLDEACEVANFISAEHLELSVKDPETLLPKIQNAGAIFMGHYTAEVLGDYVAGPNHVLPTARTARFSSPLGVYDFQKRSSIIHCSKKGSQVLGKYASILARGESLTAHARSSEYRLND